MVDLYSLTCLNWFICAVPMLGEEVLYGVGERQIEWREKMVVFRTMMGQIYICLKKKSSPFANVGPTVLEGG